MTSLARRSAHAAMWNYAGNAVRMLLQFGIGVLLARLLGPEAFGLIAIALLLIGFGQLVADFGLTSAIIQARELEPEDVGFLFTLQLAFGSVLALLGLELAGPIAAFFNAPEAVPVIRAMAAMFVLRAVGQTSVALLSRELRFRAVQTGAIASYVFGYALVGVTLALAGYGVWSLVAAQLAQSALASVVAVIQCGGMPRPRLSGQRPELVRFGGMAIAANIGSWIVQTAGSVIVGRIAGPASLGVYDRAASLAGAPSGIVVSGLQGVLFAASSRAQDKPESVKKAVLACSALFILLAGSMLLAMAATAHTVTLGLYGEPWAEVAPLLAPLSLAMVAHGTLAFIGPALNGLGRVDLEVRAQWQSAAVLVIAAIAAAEISVEAVAWAVALTYAVRLALLAMALNGLVGFTRRELALALLPALTVAALAAGAAAIAERLAADLEVEARLLVVIMAAGGGLLGGALALHRLLLRGPLGELLLQAEVLPARMQRAIAARRGD